ncbi:hypothetical protein R3X28_15045 [Maribacter sp. TH_r10]|uniref:hypothetical protein n=1 Tax=Maribacter sp. TH_r10 TaxID=3082086 RepID=UPI002953C2AB|nr:hypothetical protein [Maribacter sp. TH_r10]MDV7140207.1 hypothetical protein [Maribacter sp. TH_r10]
MNGLKFRRQFLLSPFTTDGLLQWNQYTLGAYFLYTHPDLIVTQTKRSDKEIFLLGHVLDPKNHELSTLDILNKIAEASSESDTAKVLYGLVGRYVLIIKTGERLVFFNDACGLKSFFYTQYEGQLCLASQPLLLKLVTGDLISKQERYYSYFESEYVKNSKEHWFPSGTSLYEKVHHLVPNHYLDSATMQQIRYWPLEQLEIGDYETGLRKFSELLRQTLIAGSKKYNLALGLTSGYDSRILLSASKDVSENMQYYTLLYRDLNCESNDVKIPTLLSKTLGIKYKKLDCRIELDERFKKRYLESTDMAHLDDWGYIAYGISKKLTKDVVSVKGSCSETGRCFFYKNGKHPKLTAGDDILNINPKWKGIPFIVDRMHQWFDEVKESTVNKGYNILDLFHWEVSTGSWQSQSQMEWDLVHDTFTPFNNRELLDIMLHIDTKYRCKPNYTMYRDSMNILWPEVLSQPINPLTPKLALKAKLKSLLVEVGFEKYNK